MGFAGLLLMADGRQALARQVTPQNYQTEKQSEVFKVYINGVGNGYTWVNGLNKQLGQKVLFCLPQNFSADYENYIKIIDRYLEKSRDVRPDMPIEVILLYGMQKSYPCKSK